MTPKLLAFNKDLELECPGGVVLSIKTNKEDIISFSRHDAEKKSQEEKKQETGKIKNRTRINMNSATREQYHDVNNPHANNTAQETRTGNSETRSAAKEKN